MHDQSEILFLNEHVERVGFQRVGKRTQKEVVVCFERYFSIRKVGVVKLQGRYQE